MIDHWDHRTLKAYFGAQAHKEANTMLIRKRYDSGTVISHTHEVTRTIKEWKGYLEKLGLIHYEKRGNTFFLVLENRPLIPELMKPQVSKRSNDNLRVSQKGYSANGLVHELVVGKREERERIATHTNRSSESEAYSVCMGEPKQLTLEDKFLLAELRASDGPDFLSVLRNLWTEEEWNQMMIERLLKKWHDGDGS
jgi:hypothetical protein